MVDPDPEGEQAAMAGINRSVEMARNSRYLEKGQPGCYAQYTNCKRETDRWLSCTLRSSCACVCVRVIRELGRHTQSRSEFRRGPEIRDEVT